MFLARMGRSLRSSSSNGEECVFLSVVTCLVICCVLVIYTDCEFIWSRIDREQVLCGYEVGADLSRFLL